MNSDTDLDFLVDVALEGNVMRASLRPRATPVAGTTYAYYLIRDGGIVERAPYTRNRVIDFKITGAGRYSVKAFVRNGDRKTTIRSRQFTYDGDTHDGLERLPELPYATLQEPHQDIAAIIIDPDIVRDAESGLSHLSEVLNLSLTKSMAADSFLMHSGALAGTSQHFAFSGSGKIDSRLVIGTQDIDPTGPEAVAECIGDFSVFVPTRAGFEVRTDYFGVGKIYYFSGHGISLASNRYHLLLRILSTLRVPLVLNKGKLRAGLQAVNQPFTQNFSSSMEFRGCYCLPVGSYLRLSRNQAHRKSSDIFRHLSSASNDLPTEGRYSSLISEGANEIVENLRLALEHPRFKHVRVDLTGGLDARMVAGALSRLGDRSNHVSINTADTAASPMDLPISLRLTRELQLPYDSIPRTTTEVDSELKQLELTSINLGAYYGIQAEATRTTLKDTLRVNGFYGEICARPYFARLIHGMAIEGGSPGDFPGAYLAIIPERSRPMGTTSELESCFREEFEELPGATTAAKFEAFYLFHRNGLHCSDRWSSRGGMPSWGPLQSKKLFELKWSTLESYQDVRIQLDATEVLNEKLALLPVGRDKDNSDRAALSPKYTVDSSAIEERLAVTASDRARYETARKRRSGNTRRVRQPGHAAIRESNVGRRRRSVSWAVSGIRELADVHRVISDSEADRLSLFMEQQFDAHADRLTLAGSILMNKVLSAVYQCRLA